MLERQRELENPQVCVQTLNLKRVKGLGFSFSFFTSFPPNLLSYKMLQYLTVITTKIGAWKSLQSLCSSLCRAGLLKAAAW